MANSRRLTRRRVLASGFATVGLCAMGLAAAPASSAGALSVVPTTTSVSAAPNPEGLAGNVHIVATVKILGTLPGLGVIPTGTVAFSSQDAYPVTIGSSKLSFCLLTTCTASIDTTTFKVGTDTIKAVYSGDSLTAGSTGTGSVTINYTSYQNHSTVNCQNHSTFCDAGLITDGGGTWLDLTADGQASTSHTLTEQLSGGTLGCATGSPGQEGALASFQDNPYTTTDDNAYYILTNSAKAAYASAQYAAHPNYLGCFASPTVFTNGQTGSPATQNPADGNLFEAPLPSCNFVGYVAPCFYESEGYDQLGNPAPGDVTIDIMFADNQISTGSGDPKYIGG